MRGKLAGQNPGKALCGCVGARALVVASNAGAETFLGQAKDDRAKSFYLHSGSSRVE